MLTLKILLKLAVIGTVIYTFVSVYQKEKSNGLGGQEAFRKAGSSAFGIFRTAATVAIVLFGFSGDDVSHSHDAPGTEVSQNPTQTNIGFVNAVHNDMPSSNHDAFDAHDTTTFDTHDTTTTPSSNGWDFAASALPWLLAVVALPVILF